MAKELLQVNYDARIQKEILIVSSLINIQNNTSKLLIERNKNPGEGFVRK